MALEKSTEYSPHLIDGLRIYGHLDIDAIYSALQYKAQSNDLFLLTYPRSGTNWMATIIYGLLTNGKAFDDDIDDYMLRTPLLEGEGKNFIEQTMRRPGVILSHLPFSHISYNPQAKYICVVRNPKDVCVSLWHFLNKHPKIGFVYPTFDSFFQAFVNGDTPYCAHIDYLRLLWSHKNDHNVLIITYEEMKTDLLRSIQKVAQFLSIDTTKNNHLVDRIAMNSSLKKMKKTYDCAWNDYYSQHQDQSSTFDMSISFIHEGHAGNWKSYMTDQQSQQIDEIYAEIFRDIPVLNSYSNTANKH